MDKIKKLSDAIRLGATFRPQCQDAFFKHGASCALGAAYEVITGVGDEDTFNKDKGNPYEILRERFGMSENLFDDITREIARKNDSDCLSREAIADWLESQGL